MNPSDPQRDTSGDLHDQFLDTLDEVEVCAYCGDPWTESYRGCCGETHHETVYDNGEEYLRLDDGSLEAAFVQWCSAREAAQATGAKYET